MKNVYRVEFGRYANERGTIIAGNFDGAVTKAKRLGSIIAKRDYADDRPLPIESIVKTDSVDLG